MTPRQERALVAPPDRAPEWVHKAWTAIGEGTGISDAARLLGRHPKSLRYWVVEGDAERQVEQVAQWREDNPERAKELGQNRPAPSEEQKARNLASGRRSNRQHYRRPRCRCCGGMAGIDSAPSRKGGATADVDACRRCRRAFAHQRYARLELLWLTGVPLKGIAVACGYSGTNALGATMHKLRQGDRYYLPKRRVAR